MKRGASVNQIAYIEQYKTQVEIQDILGISPRYLRLVKQGKRSGAKYADGICALYDLLRRSSEPPRKRKHPPRAKPLPSVVFVSDLMNVLFKIFEPRTWKIPTRRYQDKESKFFMKHSSFLAGQLYDTWDSFFIVFGVMPKGDPNFKRYKRIILSEEKEPLEGDSIERFIEIIESLSPREQDLIAHIPLEEWIMEAAQEIDYQESLFTNFWISRLRTPLRSPESAYSLMVEIARDSVDAAQGFDASGIEYHFIGCYGFSGWIL